MSKTAPLERPTWLETIFQDASPEPKLYAWSLSNLEGASGKDLDQKTRSRSAEDDRHRIHILGIGNLGRLYAHCLSKLPDPPPITLVVHRKSLLEHWVSNPGVEITRGDTTERVQDFDIEWWTEERPDSGPVSEVCQGMDISNLIVATKAPDALPQVDRLRRYLDGSSTIAFVQNGMNKLWPPYGDAYNSRRYPSGNHPNWIVCVTTHGQNGGAAEYLMDRISSAPHLDARGVSTSDLWVLQLEKLIVNSVINPLTAVLQCKNGVLFSKSDGAIVEVMDLLVEEASAILQALVRDSSSREILEGDRASDDKQTLNEKQAELIDRFSAPRLRAMLRMVGEKVKDNTSSMLQDVMADKQTEIGEFNGWLVDTAKYLGTGLDVSTHKTLIYLVERGFFLTEDTLGGYFPVD